MESNEVGMMLDHGNFFFQLKSSYRTCLDIDDLAYFKPHGMFKIEQYLFWFYMKQRKILRQNKLILLGPVTAEDGCSGRSGGVGGCGGCRWVFNDSIDILCSQLTVCQIEHTIGDNLIMCVYRR